MNNWQHREQRFSQPQAWPPQDSTGIAGNAVANSSLVERTGFIRKVYGLFFVGILFAIGGVLLGLTFPPLMIAVATSPWLTFFVLMGAVIGAQAVRHVPGVNLFALFGFTSLTGIMLSPLIAYIGRTNPASILEAGVLTVGVFGGLTVYAFVSKKDFSFLRGMIVTGLIIVILASLLNIFFASNAFAFALSVTSLILFSGFVLYDTSNILRRYPANEYIAGALSLYLDAFNIFISLLRILNSGRRD